MSIWLTLLIALVVPLGWGLLSSWLFDWLRARKKLRDACPPATPEETPQ
ncbi:MAG: hypothetical protein V1772_09810 [Chloroflexota bacterium]